jgi:hypothetical protein
LHCQGKFTAWSRSRLLYPSLQALFKVVHAATRLHKNRINNLSVFYLFATVIFNSAPISRPRPPAWATQCVDMAVILVAFDPPNRPQSLSTMAADAAAQQYSRPRASEHRRSGSLPQVQRVLIQTPRRANEERVGDSEAERPRVFMTPTRAWPHPRGRCGWSRAGRSVHYRNGSS